MPKSVLLEPTVSPHPSTPKEIESGRDPDLASQPQSDPVEAAADGNTYGEEQWERTLSEGESIPIEDDNFTGLGVGVAPLSTDDPLPDLDQLLQEIPADIQHLVDALFRGRFVGVQVIDRTTLI